MAGVVSFRVYAHVDPLIHQKLLRAVQPSIMRDMRRRGTNVKNLARRNLVSRSPSRYETGKLSRSIGVGLFRYKRSYGARVGTSIRYAKWVHDGTGLHGPLRRRIKPIRADYLVFRTKSGKKIVTKSVKGMAANPFLKDALKAASR